MPRKLTDEDINLIVEALKNSAESWQEEAEDGAYTMDFSAKLEGKSCAAEELALEIQDGHISFN